MEVAFEFVQTTKKNFFVDVMMLFHLVVRHSSFFRWGWKLFLLVFIFHRLHGITIEIRRSPPRIYDFIIQKVWIMSNYVANFNPCHCYLLRWNLLFHVWNWWFYSMWMFESPKLNWNGEFSQSLNRYVPGAHKWIIAPSCIRAILPPPSLPLFPSISLPSTQKAQFFFSSFDFYTI